MLEVAADLVSAARGGQGFDQADAGLGVPAVIAFGPGQACQAAQARVRLLHRGILGCIVGLEGVIDFHYFGQPAAHQGPIFLAGFMGCKARRQGLGRLLVQCHEQHAASALVQPVHGPDMATQLVAQRLHDKARLVRIQPCAMHQPAGGFVDGDQVLILPEDMQKGIGRAGGRGGVGHEEDRQYRASRTLAHSAKLC